MHIESDACEPNSKLRPKASIQEGGSLRLPVTKEGGPHPQVTHALPHTVPHCTIQEQLCRLRASALLLESLVVGSSAASLRTPLSPYETCVPCPRSNPLVLESLPTARIPPSLVEVGFEARIVSCEFCFLTAWAVPPLAHPETIVVIFFRCAKCGFGPVDHMACDDLRSHHGETVGATKISNACPRCKWFSSKIQDWPKWDGKVW